MAWGMFCWIPCPYRNWREEDRTAQVAMLPLVGACIGAICCLIWWPLSLTAANPIMIGVLLTGIYFLLTGFIHLDGFMDVSDAVMPRHPQMEERIRILKDSHVGAFAVICLVFMALIFAGAWCSVGWQFSLAACSAFVMVFTLSRMASALMVMNCRPMGTSQYAGLAAGNENGVENTIVILMGLVITVIAMILSRDNEYSTWLFSGPLVIAVIAAVTVLSGLLVGTFDRQKLGGMNGDISGHVITTSEMCGMIAIGLLV